MKAGKTGYFLLWLLLLGLSAGAQTTLVDNFNRTDLGSNWAADAPYQIVSNTLDNTSTEAGWNYYAIYLALINPTEISFKWATSGDVEGANSGGAIMRFDRTLTTGYLVLRRYGEIDLHPIIGGIIKRDVTIQSVAPSLANPKPGDVIKVVASSDATGHIFKVYINGSLDGTVKDAAKSYGNGSTLYGGVALYGQRNNNIDDYTVKGTVPPGPIQSITISAPNGGETWYANSVHNITWTSSNYSDNVKIELSTNGGTTYSTIAASVANSGIYSWTVNNTPSTTCRIRISDPSDSDPVDVSNTNFTIAPEPVDLVLTSPNGGEILYAGASHSITWTTTMTSGNIKIELSIDGGTTYSTVAASTPYNLPYVWTVPSSYSINCRVRISDAADGDPVDVSSSNFEIAAVPPDLQILNPNGGENWIIGSNQEIRWTGPGSSMIPNLAIYYSINDGGSWTTITSSTPNDGSFLWTVPGEVTTQARILIQDAADGVPSDLSDNVFTISALAILEVKSTSGQPGATNAKVTIWLTNLVNVRGVSFRITDSPNHLTCMSVTPVGRASGFSVTKSDNGTSVYAFLVHMSGGVISIGSGPIAQINYDVSGTAIVGTFSDLTLSDVTIADATSNTVVPELRDGKFYYIIKGDLTGDTFVTLVDLNRAIDIAMKRGAAASASELMAGDMDNDGDVDFFDALTIFDIVY